MIAIAAAVSLAFSTPTLRASGTGLEITQEKEMISGSQTAQTYHVSYHSETEDGTPGSGSLTVTYGVGFIPEKLKLGDWTDYEGNLKVTVGKGQESTPIFEGEYSENTEVVLENVKGGTQITIIPLGPVQARSDFSLDVSGTIYSDQSRETVDVKAEYAGTFGETQVNKSGEIQTKANQYEPGSIALEPQSLTVGYLEGADIRIRGIGGSGPADLTGYQVEIGMPDRMFVDRIQLPSFDHADYTITVNGYQQDTRNESIYINARVTSLILNIMPDGDFSQNRDMVITMRNAVNENGNGVMRATATMSFANGQSKEVTSNEVALSFTAVPIEPGEEEPDEPDQPDPPVDPDPDQPSEPEEPDTPSQPVNPVLPQPGGPQDGRDPIQAVPEEEDTVVDFSGLNLQSSKASDKSENTVFDAEDRNQGSRSTSLNRAMRDRVQTQQIFDYTGSTENTGDSEENGTSGNSSGSRRTRTASDDELLIEDDGSGTTKDKVVKAVTENRGIQVTLIIGGVLIVACVIIGVYMYRSRKSEFPGTDGDSNTERK